MWRLPLRVIDYLAQLNSLSARRLVILSLLPSLLSFFDREWSSWLDAITLEEYVGELRRRVKLTNIEGYRWSLLLFSYIILLVMRSTLFVSIINLCFFTSILSRHIEDRVASMLLLASISLLGTVKVGSSINFLYTAGLLIITLVLLRLLRDVFLDSSFWSFS